MGTRIDDIPGVTASERDVLEAADAAATGVSANDGKTSVAELDRFVSQGQLSTNDVAPLRRWLAVQESIAPTPAGRTEHCAPSDNELLRSLKWLSPSVVDLRLRLTVLEFSDELESLRARASDASSDCDLAHGLGDRNQAEHVRWISALDALAQEDPATALAIREALVGVVEPNAPFMRLTRALLTALTPSGEEITPLETGNSIYYAIDGSIRLLKPADLDARIDAWEDPDFAEWMDFARLLGVDIESEPRNASKAYESPAVLTPIRTDPGFARKASQLLREGGPEGIRSPPTLATLARLTLQYSSGNASVTGMATGAVGGLDIEIARLGRLPAQLTSGERLGALLLASPPLKEWMVEHGEEVYASIAERHDSSAADHWLYCMLEHDRASLQSGGAGFRPRFTAPTQLVRAENVVRALGVDDIRAAYRFAPDSSLFTNGALLDAVTHVDEPLDEAGLARLGEAYLERFSLQAPTARSASQRVLGRWTRSRLTHAIRVWGENTPFRAQGETAPVAARMAAVNELASMLPTSMALAEVDPWLQEPAGLAMADAARDRGRLPELVDALSRHWGLQELEVESLLRVAAYADDSVLEFLLNPESAVAFNRAADAIVENAVAPSGGETPVLPRTRLSDLLGYYSPTGHKEADKPSRFARPVAMELVAAEDWAADPRTPNTLSAVFDYQIDAILTDSPSVRPRTDILHRVLDFLSAGDGWLERANEIVDAVPDVLPSELPTAIQVSTFRSQLEAQRAPDFDAVVERLANYNQPEFARRVALTLRPSLAELGK